MLAGRCWRAEEGQASRQCREGLTSRSSRLLPSVKTASCARPLLLLSSASSSLHTRHDGHANSC
jgi:hypothetical protein